MTIQKRLIVVGFLLAFAFALYGAAKHYSPSLVQYVVEQSLAQKAPSGTDLIHLHARLNAHLSAAPDPNSRMRLLLRISAYLEKVQILTPEELDEMLAPERLQVRGRDRSYKAFFNGFGTFLL
ncbi:MAG: hypothetical protein JXA73_13920 [Acidobacteria bacterium]|nr:hypothetical protein [Acidobacteriota bacterium]